MSKLLLVPFRLYIWLLWFPVMCVLTALTAIITSLMVYTHLFNARILSYPARIWSKIICYTSFVLVRVEGLEYLDSNRSYVFASNHQSVFDIWLIYGWLPTTFCWVMKKELRKIPFVGFACEKLGHIFIDRSNPKAAKKSLDAAERKLSNGNCVVIFPEGTRTRNGQVGPFKRGAFSIATDLSLQVVPITIVGSFERIAMKGWSINPGCMKMIIHPPIDCGGTTDQEVRRLSLRTREIVMSSLSL